MSTLGNGLLETILEELQEIRARVDSLDRGAAAAPAAPAAAPANGSTTLSPTLAGEIQSALDAVPIDFGGGSGLPKAHVFASLVMNHGVRRAVEIGVYRGRSLLPLATALRGVGGTVIGIDPWSADEALQFDDHAGGTDFARDWTRKTDWEAIYRSVLDNGVLLGVSEQIELLRMPSSDAAAQIPAASVDLVHVDGNHDAAAVERDVELYLPKIRPGGFIALDDASWPSIRPTAVRLENELERFFEIHDVTLQLYDGSDFAVYRVPA